MSGWEILLLIVIAWNFIGFLCWCVILPFGRADCIQDMINLIKFYDLFDVNWFGAIICTLLMNLLSPIVSICSWCYFICTVGRD